MKENYVKRLDEDDNIFFKICLNSKSWFPINHISQCINSSFNLKKNIPLFKIPTYTKHFMIL